MKKRILVAFATLLVIFSFALLNASELPFVSCDEIGCDGYYGCACKKAVPFSCHIICSDESILFCMGD